VPEALSALVERTLSLPNVYRAWAFCDVENRASVRVLEKVGMTCEGTLRRFVVHPNVGREPRDAFCYARVR
jgi:RimJ/RimL family protein N-acetyltransferase